MNPLTPRDRELVALGAAMGSNCVPCIEYHVPQARKAGLCDAEISEAIRLADTVRQVPARKVLDAAQKMLSETSGDARATEKNGCAAVTPADEGHAHCCG
jgi:4-carboxymuconolactone decarboxylase